MKGKSKLKIDRDKIDNVNFTLMPDGTIIKVETILGFKEETFGILFLQQGWKYYTKMEFYEIAAKFFELK